MASSGQQLLYVCRGCRQTAQNALAKPALRSFSNSSLRFKEIPAFAPTASPELDALLVEWRQKVFVPAALQEQHRRLMYRKSRQHLLAGETGVTVTLSNGERVKLEPTDPWDKPNTRSSTAELTRLLSETDNSAAWNNLPAMLQGFALAKQKLPPHFLERLARKASELGRAGLLISCAERPAETNVQLNNIGLTRELMLGLHSSAAEAGFEGADFEKAARRAEHIAQLLEMHSHCGGPQKRYTPGHADMRKDSGVISVLLEFAAAKALNDPTNAELQRAAHRCTAKMLEITGRQLSSLLSGDLFKTQTGKKDKGTAQHEATKTRAALNHMVVNLIPLFHACRLAEQVESVQNDKDMAKALAERKQAVQDRLLESVAKLRENKGDKSRRGLEMFEQIQATEE